MENHFSLKGKTTKQTSNNFTIIKSITIILIYVSRLKKKNLLFFSALTHTNYLSQKATILLFFFTMWHPLLFHCAAPTFSISSSTYYIYIYIYIEFCRLTSFPRIIWIPNSTLIIILEEHYYFHNSN